MVAFRGPLLSKVLTSFGKKRVFLILLEQIQNTIKKHSLACLHALFFHFLSNLFLSLSDYFILKNPKYNKKAFPCLLALFHSFCFEIFSCFFPVISFSPVRSFHAPFNVIHFPVKPFLVRVGFFHVAFISSHLSFLLRFLSIFRIFFSNSFPSFHSLPFSFSSVHCIYVPFNCCHFPFKSSPVPLNVLLSSCFAFQLLK